ncbi:PhzF family phenazine biosynthesis protein [Paenibacillus albiflavus]|uniref:PhzF family phenazine biosynthesis protein n=1 Tax=Paenibacillus albiflavus TaxID=2545760 RepID=A0A4R4EP94_9BACL|nr:PhzF family phenazine biosynthesis protein [Paenibacillus albiflavus]TCZ80198.1 PhzF family phenazine biosynthesis protein [Paenibacillus albiflavus]
MKMYIVDSFTNKAFKGNPAAVCILESEQTDQWMQHVACEMNLSETAFLLKNGNEYALKWFTPTGEEDLCGHATLATAHILWEEQLCNDHELRFNTRSGLLTAIRNQDWIEMNFPIELEQEVTPPTELIEGLGTAYRYVGKNRMDYIIEVADETTLCNLQPNFTLWKSVPSRGIIVTSKSDRSDVDFVSRCFYPANGADEDPVTGSAHCCLGPYWQAKLHKEDLVALQLSSREGLLKLRIEEGRIIIQGQAVTTLKGELLA